MTAIFVYGTLKKGHYNHTRFKEEGLGNFITNATVDNMSLVQTNEWYPTAIPWPSGAIHGEVWEVTDQELLHRVRRMEIGAGYSEKEITTTTGEKALMWYQETTSELAKLRKFTSFPNEESQA